MRAIANKIAASLTILASSSDLSALEPPKNPPAPSPGNVTKISIKLSPVSSVQFKPIDAEKFELKIKFWSNTEDTARLNTAKHLGYGIAKIQDFGEKPTVIWNYDVANRAATVTVSPDENHKRTPSKAVLVQPIEFVIRNRLVTLGDGDPGDEQPVLHAKFTTTPTDKEVLNVREAVCVIARLTEKSTFLISPEKKRRDDGKTVLFPL